MPYNICQTISADQNLMGILNCISQGMVGGDATLGIIIVLLLIGVLAYYFRTPLPLMIALVLGLSFAFFYSAMQPIFAIIIVVIIIFVALLIIRGFLKSE